MEKTTFSGLKGMVTLVGTIIGVFKDTKDGLLSTTEEVVAFFGDKREAYNSG